MTRLETQRELQKMTDMLQHLCNNASFLYKNVNLSNGGKVAKQGSSASAVYGLQENL
jgi:hypothetical protein